MNYKKKLQKKERKLQNVLRVIFDSSIVTIQFKSAREYITLTEEDTDKGGNVSSNDSLKLEEKIKIIFIDGKVKHKNRS